MSADPLSDPPSAELRATATDEEDETFVYPSAALPITGLSRTVHQGSDDGTTDDSGTTPKAWRSSAARTVSNPWRTGASDGEEPLFATRDELTGNPFASMESAQTVDGPPDATDEVMPAASQADAAGMAKAVQKAAAEGDVSALGRIFFPDPSPSSHPSAFSLANDVQLGTGMSPLMISASRGKLSAVRFFVEKAGGIVDMEDAEGETALHKAAYRGHLAIIKYLLSATISASALTTPVSSRASSRSPSASSEARGRPGGLANVEQADHDGWTALHGACSRGYLDIVRYLVEEGGATVDVQSKGGYTPLMNAASRGHLPVVNYLTTRKSPNPFVRNAHGETAYDVAAASFEVHICEVLSTYEAGVWGRRRHVDGAKEDEGYDPLALHTTVAVIVHENQRLDLRLGTLAAGLATGAPSTSTSTPSTTGKVAFKASALSRNDNRAPWTVPPSSKGVNSTGRHLAVGSRDDVGLPTTARPFEMVLPNPPSAGSSNAPTSTAERSHFWLSEWQVDLTPPSVDPSDGWSYATSFDAPADQWSAEKPQELERLLDPGVSGGGGLLKERVGIKWVRRRRWVRVCRRRLDRPPIGFADVEEEDDEEGLAKVGRGREAGDYVARAKYLAGTRGKRRDGDAASVRSGHTDDAKAAGRAELMRTVAKVGRAIGELREGMLRDDDEARRQEARTLVDALNARLEDLQQRLDQDDADEDEEDEEFHYPAPVDDAGPSDYFTRPALTSTLSTTSSLGRVPDLTPQLSLAPDFRVPTHDQASTKATAPSSRRQRFPSAPPLSPIRVDRIDGGPRWERDADAPSCRRCGKRFSFFVRKHHCRRCGLVVCASCSSNEDKMDPQEVVVEPGGMGGEVIGMVMGGFVFRTCDPCHLALREEGQGREGLSAAAAAVAGTATAMGAEGGVNDAASDVSDLSECPVCGFSLARLQTKGEQEDHVRMCLEEGGGTVQPTGRYLVFMLTEGSPLVGNECTICFESLSIGSKIGRLSCLCFFHAHCIGAWLSRGHGCPVHSSRYL